MPSCVRSEACKKIKRKGKKMTPAGFEPATLAGAVWLAGTPVPGRRAWIHGVVATASQSPYRLVVRILRCGRDNPGSTPGEDML